MGRTIFTFALVLGAVVAAAPASAQTPTEAQQKALRANCPSDFRQYCSGVPTGGMDALVCLEKNVGSLSSGCKSAVEAVEGPPAAAGSSEGTANTDATESPSTSSAPPSTASAPSAETKTSTPPESTPSSSAPAAHEPELTLRQEMRLAAGACAIDFRLFCPNLPVGHGNILFCLRVHGPRLAPACRDALVKAGVPVD